MLPLAVALPLALGQLPGVPLPASAGELELASGWISMVDEGARAEWGDLPAGWALSGGVLRRPTGSTEHLGWGFALSEPELDFQWRSGPAEAWQRGRIVVRADQTALALLGAERIDRALDSGLPSFRAGPFELTPAQKEPGWHVALRPGAKAIERPGAEAIELRGLRLRDRARPVGKPVEIFDGKSLAGWRALGDAQWSVENGELVGEVGGGSQSFLATERELGDFILEVEVKNDLPGNSGIQIRSHENEAKRLIGYQIEIDPSPRGWSGGLYDEARRGWLDDLSDDAQARAAFKSGEWNRYRIECIGPWIRAWVNDVPTADYLDARDLCGVIGLQVHSGKDTKVRWRNFRVHELGRSRWTGLAVPGAGVAELDLSSDDLGFRRNTLLINSGGGGLRLRYGSTDALRGFKAARETDSPSNPLRSLRLAGPDWTATADPTGLGTSFGEVLILCHPPRLAIEIDGRRISAFNWESAARQRDMGIEVWIEHDLAFYLERAEALARD